ncbi:4-hydroxybenzoyl-CoA thioesterase OS=Castellaniella defragrans OX=75697 GN=HNR28_000735 PE=4 SV=1 [Castellaniella defragrans]
MNFERVYPIRFSHCDPAGIVFFPQYLVLFNQLVEDWFTLGLGIPYANLIAVRRVGLPTVHLECDFRAVSRMGDEVTFSLRTERVGSKSLSLALEARCGGQLRVGARQVLVCTDLETHRSIDIPADLRAAFSPASTAPSD